MGNNQLERVEISQIAYPETAIWATICWKGRDFTKHTTWNCYRGNNELDRVEISQNKHPATVIPATIS